MKLKPKGLIVPMLTPLNVEGGLDVDAIKSHVDFLIESGVHGLFPLGTAGEFALLSRDERLKVIESVVDGVEGRVPVYAGVSDPSTDNAIDYAKAAKDFGANGVVATSPYYFKTNDEGILTHFTSIAEEADIPLIIYNIPSNTYQPVSISVAEKLAEHDLIIGMKYTTNDLHSFQNYVRAIGGKISMLIGADSLFYSALELGAVGGVLGGANVAPSIFADIYNAYVRGDKDASMEFQRRILPIVDLMELGTFPSSLKEAMAVIGRPLGGVRRPLTNLSASDSVKVTESLRSVGLISE
jgi:4-hydroxy-tetrahydrodipicolinate synthase